MAIGTVSPQKFWGFFFSCFLESADGGSTWTWDGGRHFTCVSKKKKALRGSCSGVGERNTSCCATGNLIPAHPAGMHHPIHSSSSWMGGAGVYQRTTRTGQRSVRGHWSWEQSQKIKEAKVKKHGWICRGNVGGCCHGDTRQP